MSKLGDVISQSVEAAVLGVLNELSGSIDQLKTAVDVDMQDFGTVCNHVLKLGEAECEALRLVFESGQAAIKEVLNFAGKLTQLITETMKGVLQALKAKVTRFFDLPDLPPSGFSVTIKELEECQPAGVSPVLQDFAHDISNGTCTIRAEVRS